MKIIQQTNMTLTQMMGYTFVADSGHVLVVDGGYTGNDGELRRIIESVGGHVDLWLITHPHRDHHNAVIDLLSAPGNITYDRLGSSRLDDDWAVTVEPRDSDDLKTWNAFARGLDERYFEILPGQRFELGSMTVEVLAGTNPDLTMNPFNNQSCVFRITEGDFTMLVLGDLGVEAGRRLMDTGIDLKADAVQMAHHGQNGVEEAFYQAVAPTYAFWSTPDWLWNNIVYDKEGNHLPGHFKTLEVRAWMEKLNTVNITSMEHTVVFDTHTKKVEKY